MDPLVRKRVDTIKYLLRWKEKIILIILDKLNNLDDIIHINRLFDKELDTPIRYDDFREILNFMNREGLITILVNSMIRITTIGKIFLEESKTEIDKDK